LISVRRQEQQHPQCNRVQVGKKHKYQLVRLHSQTITLVKIKNPIYLGFVQSTDNNTEKITLKNQVAYVGSFKQ